MVHSHKVKAASRRNSSLDVSGHGPSTAKRDRPSKSDPLTSPARAVRNPAHKPKEKICVFSPCNFEGDDLLQVKSDSRGKKLIDIKNSTTDDKVRACLSTLVDPGDASAQEIWYHKNCIVYAERTCIMDYDNYTDNRYSEKRKLVDLEFVAIAKYALGDGETFNMCGLNEKYISLLIEH